MSQMHNFYPDDEVENAYASIENLIGVTQHVN